MVAPGTDAPGSSVTRPVTDAMDTACPFRAVVVLAIMSSAIRLTPQNRIPAILKNIMFTPCASSVGGSPCAWRLETGPVREFSGIGLTRSARARIPPSYPDSRYAPYIGVDDIEGVTW